MGYSDDMNQSMVFVEFSGKKEYKCPDCKEPIKYAKFQDAQGKLITDDGQPPNGKFGKESNVTGFKVNPNTKEIHTCSKSSQKGRERGFSTGRNSNFILEEFRLV